MTNLDPRLYAFRSDLADETLRGKVDAPAFAKGMPQRVTAGRVPLMMTPSADGRMGSELLFGETVKVFEHRDGWAWLQNAEDQYVGYARSDGLGEPTGEPTDQVSALRTFLYTEPDLKSPVLDLLSMNSLLSEQGREQGFLGLTGGGWVWASHTVALQSYESDFTEVALRFLGTPYLWGGRSSIGLDCSGLVQMAFARCGRWAPRDSDMQACLGETVTYDGAESTLRHGDLVFWPGHVGIWLEGGAFVHANATDMMVATGSFSQIAGQIRETTGSDIIAVRRP